MCREPCLKDILLLSVSSTPKLPGTSPQWASQLPRGLGSATKNRWCPRGVGTAFWLVAYCVSLDRQSHTSRPQLPSWCSVCLYPSLASRRRPCVFLSSHPTPHHCLQPGQEDRLSPPAELHLSLEVSGPILGFISHSPSASVLTDIGGCLGTNGLVR